jgi:hypothetical protein
MIPGAEKRIATIIAAGISENLRYFLFSEKSIAAVNGIGFSSFVF